MSSVPTASEKYAELMEHLRKAQEASAMLSHLERANDQQLIAQGWLAVSEMLKRMLHQVTQLAMGKLH